MEHDLRQCHSTWSFSFTELRRVDVFAEEVDLLVFIDEIRLLIVFLGNSIPPILPNLANDATLPPAIILD